MPLTTSFLFLFFFLTSIRCGLKINLAEFLAKEQIRQYFKRASTASMPLCKSWAPVMRLFSSHRDVLPETGSREWERCLVPTATRAHSMAGTAAS